MIQGNPAFAELGYALYLGSSEKPRGIAGQQCRAPPDPGPALGESPSPFGDNKLRHRHDAGRRVGRHAAGAKLQWLLLGFGLLLTAGAAALTERLVRRREQAQQLADELGEIADENARLYAAQRTVAQTLQHSLLPEALPEIPGLAVGSALHRGRRRHRHRWRLVRRHRARRRQASCSSSVTSPVAASPPRRSWPRCGTRSGRTPRRATTRRRSSPSSASADQRRGRRPLRDRVVRRHRRGPVTRSRSRTPRIRSRS